MSYFNFDPHTFLGGKYGLIHAVITALLAMAFMPAGIAMVVYYLYVEGTLYVPPTPAAAALGNTGTRSKWKFENLYMPRSSAFKTLDQRLDWILPVLVAGVIAYFWPTWSPAWSLYLEWTTPLTYFSDYQ